MKKKLIKFLTILLCSIIITGCDGKSSSTESKVNEKKYTSNDLIVNTEYQEINQFLNELFIELDFVGDMKLTEINDVDDHLSIWYFNGNTDTGFIFNISKTGEFQQLNVIYDKSKTYSLELAKKIIKYSKFDFSSDDLIKIEEYLSSGIQIMNVNIGNYIVSNLASGMLMIESKDEEDSNAIDVANMDNSANQSNEIKNDDNNNTNTQPQNNSQNVQKTITQTQNNSQQVQQSTTQKAKEEPTTTKVTEAPTTQPTTQATTKQIENSVPSISVSKQNALKKAQSYLSYSSFSRQGLIEQLEYEGFPNEDAIYAVDNVGADWNTQALKKAQSYLSHSSFSKQGLIEQLEFEEFTSEQVNYAINNISVDWNAQALNKAQSYLSHSSFSRQGLIEQLEFEGFLSDQVNYAINNINVDWNVQAQKKAQSYLSHSSFSRQGLIEQLEFEGFTHEQAVYGVEQNGL